MLTKKKRFLLSGQSLVEVTIATSIIVVVLLGLVSLITLSIANVEVARNKVYAVKYAQEAIEWMRNERDKNWGSFYNQTIRNYCLPTLSWNNYSTCLTDNHIDDKFDFFYREVSFPDRTGDKVLLNVRVYWDQGNRTSEVNLQSYLTKWE